jgi:pyruvate,orthophosphate dikinase
VFDLLETHYRDMQDIEFTVERGKLGCSQTRRASAPPKAALKIAVDMAGEGLISEEEAVLRVDPSALDQLLHPTLDPAAERKSSPRGFPASPGAPAERRVRRRHGRAHAARREGDPVRIETARGHSRNARGAGILTARGGMTSHAAVVARGWAAPASAAPARSRSTTRRS